MMEDSGFAGGSAKPVDQSKVAILRAKIRHVILKCIFPNSFVGGRSYDAFLRKEWGSA
ncbi:hypothetical protein ACFSLT_24350 [Novosphingobium resinovorum]